MTKASLLEILRPMPDDAVLVAFNGDSGRMELVTGLLYGRHDSPFSHSDGELPEGSYIVEICTDDP